MKYDLVALGSLCKRVVSGGTPKSTISDYYNGDIPWLNTKEVHFNRIYKTEKTISVLGLQNSSAKWISPRCIIVAMYGATAGNIAINLVPLTTNQACCNLQIDDAKADYRYIYYYLKANYTKLSSLANGGAQQNLNAKLIKDFLIAIPSLQVQRNIAGILWSIDDKIELNNKINENLERQAQAIYQEWFGNINMEKGQGTLADICTYSKDRVSVSELNVSTYFSTENMLPGKAGATEASSLPTTTQTTACHVGDTLISNIRPYFKKIVYCHDECGCSTDVLCFVPVHPKYSAYLYSTLYADKFFDFMVAGSKGTKMPRGDKQQIMTYPMTLPTDTELERFNSVAVPILTQIQNSRNENKRLSLLRDTLLPKLISGEIYI